MASLATRRVLLAASRLATARTSANGLRLFATAAPASAESAPTPAAAKTTTAAASSSPPYPNESPDLYKSDGSPSDWSKSFSGLGAQAFPKEAADVLMAPLDPSDVEIKPGARTSHTLLASLIPFRWLDLLARDQVPQNFEQSLRPGRMGACPAQRDQRLPQDREQRVRSDLHGPVRIVSSSHTRAAPSSFVAWSALRAASKSILILRVLRRRPSPARATLSCAVARTWVSPASFGPSDP